MIHRLKLAAAGVALLCTPTVVHADDASIQVDVGGTAPDACGMGAPDYTVLDLHDLTGPDGLLDPGKTGNLILATATIADAWCNTAHTLAIQGVPMVLQTTPPYAQPGYLARKVTFDARLTGWVVPVNDRPKGTEDPFTVGPVTSPFATHGAGLQLNISRLQTLTAGSLEQPNLMLEPGNYRGTVTITLAVAN